VLAVLATLSSVVPARALDLDGSSATETDARPAPLEVAPTPRADEEREAPASDEQGSFSRVHERNELLDSVLRVIELEPKRFRHRPKNPRKRFKSRYLCDVVRVSRWPGGATC
jgi:hypothetical protein